MTEQMEKIKELVQQGICCIQLGHGCVAYVDPDDWVTLNRKTWNLHKSRKGSYARNKSHATKKIGTGYLHKVIAKTPKGMICHHKNRNPLDDRKRNLRNVSIREHSRQHFFW